MTARPADLPPLLGEATLDGRLLSILEVVRPRVIVPGWATVELERAEGQLAGSGSRPDSASQAPAPVAALPPDAPDDLLGARTRLIAPADDRRVVLLEPSTEGPLAAGLARHGEGWLAAYLVADSDAPARIQRAGLRLSVVGRGPFGPERRLLVGPRDGPFILVTSSDRQPSLPSR